jgi:hypothetical protein
VATAAFAQNPNGTWRCTRCLTSGFANPQGVIGHRHGKACKRGLGGVAAEVGGVRDRNSGVEIRSVGAAPEAVSQAVQPSQQSGIVSPTPVRLHPAMMGTVRTIPFVQAPRAQNPAPAVSPAPGQNEACPGCLALAGEVRVLREDLAVVATSTFNHLGHAEIALAQAKSSEWTTTEKFVAAGAAVVAAAAIAWWAGAFDPKPASRARTSNTMGDSKSSLGSSIEGVTSLLDFVGKGARAFKSLRGIF